MNDSAPRTDPDVLHCLDCVTFVRDCVNLSSRDAELSPGGQVNATGICRVLLEYAVDQFGAEGKEVFVEWGIPTSEDVGLIVSRLIDAGLTEETPATGRDRFRGLFDVRLPPEQWKLQW